MGTIIEHIPSYYSGFEPKKRRFDTIEELHNIKFVKRYINLFDDFKQLSISYINHMPAYLMLERDKGFKWYVVGYLNKDSINIVVDMPEFKPKKRGHPKSTKIKQIKQKKRKPLQLKIVPADIQYED